MTLEYARRKIAKLKTQRNYWRRRVLNPNYERDRMAKWRRENPAKYRRQLRREKLRQRNIRAINSAQRVATA